MSKVDVIRSFQIDNYYTTRNSILLGLINCLLPSEACDLLLWSIGKHPLLRRYALRKILRDVTRRQESCHVKLIDSLLKMAEEVSVKDKQTCGYLISAISEGASDEIRARVIGEMLVSEYRSVRRRAYKLLHQTWNEQFATQVEDNWKRHGEPETVSLIIKNFDVIFLMDNADNLMKSTREPWQVSRLFLRITEKHPEQIGRLKERDSISYFYVAAKNKIYIAPNDVMEIAISSKDDMRYGLLLWSLRELGYWDVLIEVEKQNPPKHIR